MKRAIAETCAYCGRPAEGNYSIHQFGMDDGPEVPLCDLHGSKVFPTCEEIWAGIARRESVNKEGEG